MKGIIAAIFVLAIFITDSAHAERFMRSRSGIHNVFGVRRNSNRNIYGSSLSNRRILPTFSKRNIYGFRNNYRNITGVKSNYRNFFRSLRFRE